MWQFPDQLVIACSDLSNTAGKFCDRHLRALQNVSNAITYHDTYHSYNIRNSYSIVHQTTNHNLSNSGSDELLA